MTSIQIRFRYEVFSSNIFLKSGGISIHLRIHKPFKISSNGFDSLKVDEDLRDKSTVLFSYFPTLTSSQGGTHIETKKGGGQWKKATVGSSYEIIVISWFTKVGEV